MSKRKGGVSERNWSVERHLRYLLLLSMGHSVLDYHHYGALEEGSG